jgi:DNA-binding PadR family transcriptional regulator
MTEPSDPRSFLPLTPLAFQVLLAMADSRRHGYAIIREVESRTDGLIKLRTGTLYTLLQRLLDEDLIAPAESPVGKARAQRNAPGRVQGGPPIKDDERRRYFELTPLGRNVLSAEARRLESLVGEARRKQVLGRTRNA